MNVIDRSAYIEPEDSSYLHRWVRISELLSTYGDLLPDRMHKMLQAYYSDDMSLSEIAEETNVSRQAVHDSLKRGEEHLERYESNLKTVSIRTALRRAVDHLNEELVTLSGYNGDPEYQKIRELLTAFSAEFEAILSEGSQ